MPIGFGAASSHATFIMLKTPEEWERYYQISATGKPQPLCSAGETPEVIQSYIDRIERSLRVMAEQTAAYDPELLITIGGDQHEIFDPSNVPSIMMYVGGETWGHNVLRLEAPSEKTFVPFPIDVETSEWLLHQLVTQEGFDIAFSSDLDPAANRGRGLPHAFVRPGCYVRPRHDVPNVLVWLNTYHTPCLPAQRCYELGRALARLLKNDPRRIAIIGSGGLSHDPLGPRAGWFDEPMDRWFLEQLERGNGRATAAMFQFDSMTMRGGTGEMRAWITVAGAMDEMGWRADIIDYIGTSHGMGGLGFVCWSPSGTTTAPAQASA